MKGWPQFNLVSGAPRARWSKNLALAVCAIWFAWSFDQHTASAIGDRTADRGVEVVRAAASADGEMIKGVSRWDPVLDSFESLANVDIRLESFSHDALGVTTTITLRASDYEKVTLVLDVLRNSSASGSIAWVIRSVQLDPEAKVLRAELSGAQSKHSN